MEVVKQKLCLKDDWNRRDKHKLFQLLWIVWVFSLEMYIPQEY